MKLISMFQDITDDVFLDHDNYRTYASNHIFHLIRVTRYMIICCKTKILLMKTLRRVHHFLKIRSVNIQKTIEFQTFKDYRNTYGLFLTQ